jgi:hypothetical protein
MLPAVRCGERSPRGRPVPCGVLKGVHGIESRRVPVHVLISALAAGLVAILATVAIERLGGRRGGVVGTLPTTIVPAAVGFWWGASKTVDFQDALYVVPAGMMVNALFLWSWRVIPARLPGWKLRARLLAMVATSMSAWVVMAFLLLRATEAYREAGLPMPLWGWGFFLAAASFATVACLRNGPAPAGTRPVGTVTLLGRGLLAACAIGLAVALATVSGPVIAGIVSIFPAIFLTTMLALWISQGEAVPAGAVGPMMLGSTSVSAFALLAATLMPFTGPAVGALVAWIGAVLLVTLPAWLFLESRSRSASAPSGDPVVLPPTGPA